MTVSSRDQNESTLYEKRSSRSTSELQSDGDYNDDHLTKCFDDYLTEYPDIPKYINEFQVKLSGTQSRRWNLSLPNTQSSGATPINSKEMSPSPSQPSAQNQARPSIIVFKKKKLNNYNGDNIYEHNLSNPDIDTKDNSKSKVSCLRCRKFKKKCSRSLPECSNCASSDELCVFLPRKLKTRKSKSPSPISQSQHSKPTNSSQHKDTSRRTFSMTKSSSLPFPLPPIDSTLYPQTHQAPLRSTYSMNTDTFNTFQNKRLSLPNLHSVIQTAESSTILPSGSSPLNFTTPNSSASLSNAPNYSYSEQQRKELQQLQKEETEKQRISSPCINNGFPTVSTSTSKHSNDFDKILN